MLRKPSVRLRVDDRVGSKHLAVPLQNYQIQTKLRRLDYGDVWFEGWKEGEIVRVGIELKRLDDLIGSMLSKRLIDRQLPGMSQEYDVCYLVVEGVWRPNRDGAIEILRCGEGWARWIRARTSVTYSQVTRFLTTLRAYGGVWTWRTADTDETIAYIADQFHWWQKKRHKAHLGFHRLPKFDTNALDPDVCRRRLRRMADELPYVGWFRSIDIADHFSSIRDMVNAPAERWIKIPKFGPKMATEIDAALDAKVRRR